MVWILEPQRNDIVQALMRSLQVVVMFNLFEDVAKMLLFCIGSGQTGWLATRAWAWRDAVTSRWVAVAVWAAVVLLAADQFRQQVRHLDDLATGLPRCCWW